MSKKKANQKEKENPIITLEVKAQLAFAPHLKNLKKQTVRFTLQDTAVTITETSEDGTRRKIGEVVGSMGGTIEIRDEESKETWVIRPLDLWEAFAKAKGPSLKGKTQPCPYCNKPIPYSGRFGLPTYTDVPENHAENCPIREVMEVRLAELEKGTR